VNIHTTGHEGRHEYSCDVKKICMNIHN